MNAGSWLARPLNGSTPKKLLLPALALAVLALGFAARFHRLDQQSLWYDEGVAYAHSLRALPELIPLLQRNVHVPAYFTLLGWWQDVTGSSEFVPARHVRPVQRPQHRLDICAGQRPFPPRRCFGGGGADGIEQLQHLLRARGAHVRHARRSRRRQHVALCRLAAPRPPVANGAGSPLSP